MWVYPTQPKGKYYSIRTVLSFFLLAFLFGAPFIRVDGHPFLQFDILNRHFYIFGLVFWPQDLHLFVLAGITFFVFIILFTTVYGRLFCGWICPQTIFLEMVFRKIEYIIEGNGPRQKQLDHAEWSPQKLFKKSSKLIIFYAIAFLIGNTFLAYIIGIESLWDIVSSPPTEHLTGFIAMVIFSFIFFWVFTWFREQACTLVCPYGRLQGVLLDKNSMVVMYDFKRGEPRGPAKRNQTRVGGDCIECDACVRVCPTGIDIRNGIQLECVNCTACMDACDRTMERMKFPTGLIRYASQDQITYGGSRKITPRIILYSTIFLVLLGVTSTLLILRSEVEASILRTTGSLYEELPDGNIRNLYTIRVTNKTSKELPVTLKLAGNRGTIELVGPELTAPPNGQDQSVFTIVIPKKNLFTSNTPVVVELYSQDELLETVPTTFDGPMPGKSK